MNQNDSFMREYMQGFSRSLGTFLVLLLAVEVFLLWAW